MKKLILAFFLLFVAAVTAVAGAAFFWWSTPVSKVEMPVEYELKEKATLKDISADLVRLGVIRWPLVFRIYGRYTNQASRIKAGTYSFTSTELPSEVFEKLVKGSVVTIQFNIPEGLNMWQIAEKLAEVFPHIPKQQWLQDMSQTQEIADLVPEAKNLEGFLFPETYTIQPKATSREVLSMMVSMFKRNFDKSIIEAGERLSLKPYDVVTLASIIEKETGLPSERPHISQVFHNRMKRKMRLQTDPTVIYGMWDRYDGNIRKKDLQTYSPYNTYVIDGLPPGPIANPGKLSLQAAVTPQPGDDLYFVGKGDGSHFFSRTLEEHNSAVYNFQIRPTKRK